jgi:transposase
VNPRGFDAGSRPGFTSEGAEEIKRLKAETKRLRGADEVLRKASIFFAGSPAPATVDRRVHRPDDG